ncbi:MAG: hypothetical protein BWZ02_02915 [Lentisphaerae bacterium ADurb.BinA184]|nr:MAG: hypothetical protein BWZ02_02915 [Lentisphaerae bacterium ADurb.BinA184]
MADRHLLAGFGAALADHAGDRGHDQRILKVFVCDGERRLGLLALTRGQIDVGLGHRHPGLGLCILREMDLVLVVGDRALLVEPGVAFEVRLGFAGGDARLFGGGDGDLEGGLGDVEGLLGDGEGIAALDRIDLEEPGFAGGDGVALIDPDGVEVAVGAGGDVGIAAGLEGALHGEAAFEGAFGGGFDADGECAGVRGGGRCRGRGRGVGLAGATGEGGGEGGEAEGGPSLRHGQWLLSAGVASGGTGVRPMASSRLAMAMRSW